MLSAAMSTSMLELQDVYRYYGARCAVSALSFRIAEGEAVGLLGLNGAGKSTTLRMLAGLSSPTRGVIRVRGQALSPEAHDLRALIGFLPDRPPVYEAMTVHAYLRFAAKLRGVLPSQVERRVTYVIEACDLTRVVADAIATLSHGFRQRVGIAQASVHEPPLVVLDEPSQGLDPAQRLSMRALVRTLQTRHTVVLSTHLLSEIGQCCDRVLLLHEGRLHAEGSEAQIVQRFAQASAHAMDVVVRGSRVALEAALSGLADVNRYEIREIGPDLHVHLACERDLRAQVSRTLVQAGVELLELRASGAGLESVFAALVQKPTEAAA